MKISYALLLGLALPLSLGAQAAPATANPITAAFRARTLGLQRNIAQAFDSIPESKFGYKPTPAQLTFGYIAQHIANDDYLFCNNFGAMKATLSPKETTTPDSIKATWPKDVLVSQLKASLDFCEKAFDQLDDSKLGDQVAMTFNGNTRNVVRVSMVLGHALDMADHYSQRELHAPEQHRAAERVAEAGARRQLVGADSPTKQRPRRGRRPRTRSRSARRPPHRRPPSARSPG